MKNNIISIALLIGLIVLLIVGIHLCNRAPEYVTETFTETVYETVYDSVEKIVHVPVPGAVITLPPDTVFVYDETRCSDLFSAFHSKNIYENVLKDDSDAYISVRDTVFRNKLMGRTLTYKDRTPTEFITTTTTTTNIMNNSPKYRLFAGPVVTYSPVNGSGIGAGFVFCSKTFAAGYSYDFVRNTSCIQLFYSIFRNENKNQNK